MKAARRVIRDEGPDPIDVFVGQRVRERRLQQGLSQEALSRLLDSVSFQQLQKYECAVNRISASRLYRLAQVLAVVPGYFFEGYVEPAPPEPVKRRGRTHGEAAKSEPIGDDATTMSEVVVQWNDRKNRHEILVGGTRQYFVTFNERTNPTCCDVRDVRYAKLLEVAAETPPIGLKKIVAMIEDGSLRRLQDERHQRRVEASQIARRVLKKTVDRVRE